MRAEWEKNFHLSRDATKKQRRLKGLRERAGYDAAPRIQI
jgi:hypothetical protein